MQKVLVIDLHCDALLPAGVGEFGGGNTYSKSIISVIKNIDVDFLYVTRKKINSLSDREKIASNIKYVRLNISQEEVEDKDTLYLHVEEIYTKLVALLGEINFVPQLIHSIYWPSGIVAEKLSIFYNVPFIHTVLSNGRRKQIQRGDYEISKIRITSEEKCFKAAKFIICSSRYELEDIQTLYGIPNEKLILTGLDVDFAFKNPSYDRTGSYLLNSASFGTAKYITVDSPSHLEPSFWWNKGAFLYYGRLHPDKGIYLIIECWIELKKCYPDFPALWIVGGTPEQIYHIRKKISNKQYLEDLEESNDIIWWGRLSPEGISTLMLKALALLSHSRYESGGLMVLEAMAHKLPVIATPFGYARDYIKDWENGFLIPYGDCSLLKRRMIHFYNQPFLTSIMGEWAGTCYKEIDKEFNFAKKHIHLYKTMDNAFLKVENQSIEKTPILPYPLTEYIPNDEMVLSYFTEVMQKLSHNTGIPILKDSINYLNYHRWIIEFNNDEYECFMWKTTINKRRVYLKKEKFFYTKNELFKTDNYLYENDCCKAPINKLLADHITVYPLRNEPISFSKINEDFLRMFSNKKEDEFIERIDYYKLVEESKIALDNYECHLESTLKILYYYLKETPLIPEKLGLVPLELYTHTFANNAFAHVGNIRVGTKSYFYASYALQFRDNILDFLETYIENPELKRNTVLWILNLKLYDAVCEYIDNNNLSTQTMETIMQILSFLE